MAGTFPSLASGFTTVYPVSRETAVSVRVLEYSDNSEQRFLVGAALNSWALEYRSLSADDVAAMEAFFDDQKGAFDRSWTFPFDSVAYTSCLFDQDDFSPMLGANRRYSLTLKIRQTEPSMAVPASPAFPELASGAVVQAPYCAAKTYETIRNQMSSGIEYAWAQRQFPLMTFTLSYPLISEEEMGALLSFFLARRGRWEAFAFTDPISGTTYDHCRFATDRFESRYIDRRQCSVSNLRIFQFAQN